MLPQSSTMEVLYRNGTEFRSETYYSGCRRPGATEAALAAAPAPADTPETAAAQRYGFGSGFSLPSTPKPRPRATRWLA